MTTDIHPRTARHPLADGEVHLLGAVHSVTGAMTRVDVAGARLLVDCGVPQGRESDGWSLPEATLDARALLLTHAHNDHVGSIPDVLGRGFDRPIYGTRATIDIAKLVLDDGLHLQDVPESERKSLLARFTALSRVVPYDAAIEVEGVRVAFREAGHILGSASVEVTTGKSRVIISGDLGRPHSPILRDYCTTWDRGQAVDLVVMESTYGDKEHRMSHDDVERELLRILKRAQQLKGHILVPAFAIGRTQTLLWHLNKLVESRQIEGLPVAVDTPMGLAVTETYAERRSVFDQETLDDLRHGDDPFEFANLYAVHRGRDSARLRDVPGPMLVIAGNGMCSGGRIVGHLRDLLPEEKTTVLFVGFQAPGTPGRAIQEAARSGRKVRMQGEDVTVRAHIETLSGLSAHADRVELSRWLTAVPDVRRVGLFHGEPDAQVALAEWLKQGAGARATPES